MISLCARHSSVIAASDWTPRTPAQTPAPRCPSRRWRGWSGRIPSGSCRGWTDWRRLRFFTWRRLGWVDKTPSDLIKRLTFSIWQNFIVRKCSQSDSTALSVKLGYEHGFVVDHFIIKDRDGRVSLKSSSLEFDTLLSLVYHHMSQVDSLPVVLALPSILRNTDTRQCLTSLALLGRGQIQQQISSQFISGGIPTVCSLRYKTRFFSSIPP